MGDHFFERPRRGRERNLYRLGHPGHNRHKRYWRVEFHSHPSVRQRWMWLWQLRGRQRHHQCYRKSHGSYSGHSGFGLDAVAGGNGTATVNYNGGTIDLTGGSFSDGIFATARGSATITTLPGTTIMVSSTSAAPTGVDAFATNGAATATVASTILINGNPTVPTTNYKSNPTGIRAPSDLGGDVSVTYTGPGITVHGGGGLGIVAVSGSSDATTASGSVTVNASGGQSSPTARTRSVSSPTAALYAMYLVRGDVHPPR